MLILFFLCVCIDGHNTPVFQKKFVFSLIEGLREISVALPLSQVKKYKVTVSANSPSPNVNIKFNPFNFSLYF